MFTKPVDTEEVPDYNMIIQKPMDLETMMTKIDMHSYLCARDFLDDIDLICRNALEYNPDRLVSQSFLSIFLEALSLIIARCRKKLCIFLSIQLYMRLSENVKFKI